MPHTIRGTLTVSPATKGRVKQFQRLMRAALLAGALAGLVLFAYQYLVVVPRILAAEVFEDRAEPKVAADGHAHKHEDEEWKPAAAQRNLITAATTVLTGIGFASVLLAVVSLGGFPMDFRRGLLWGIGGFVCFTLAPAIGLPPGPPGVPEADVRLRQLWWLFTVCATVGAILLAAMRGRGWMPRVAAAVLVALPHAIGAPQASGHQVVPAEMVREFAVVSVVGMGLFWVVLGGLTGILFKTEGEAGAVAWFLTGNPEFPRGISTRKKT